MYKCKNCNSVFDVYTIVTEESGEIWCVCPYCKSVDFDEVRAINDKFLFIAKTEVLDVFVTVIAAINEGDVLLAKEIITEFICELVGESQFKYRDELITVKDADKDELLSELCTLLEIVYM